MGNGKGRGLSVLAAEGLVTRYTYRCFSTANTLLQGECWGSVLACLAYAAMVRAEASLMCSGSRAACHDKHILTLQCQER